MKLKSIQVFLNIEAEFPPHCIGKYVIPLEFGEYALKHPDTIYKTIAQVINLEENGGEAK